MTARKLRLLKVRQTAAEDTITLTFNRKLTPLEFLGVQVVIDRLLNPPADPKGDE